MKLVRYGPPGKEKPGLIDDEGKLRDLSRKVKDIGATALAPGELAKLRKLDPKKLPLVKGRPRLGPCVATPPKFIAIGVNYRPESERLSHYFHTRLPKQFDAVIHFDETRAVEPLERTSVWDKGELPETYPFKV